MGNDSGWLQCETSEFWCSLAANDHVVQIYENDATLLSTLADFASDGFVADNSVIIIATGNHLEQLKQILISRGFNPDNMLANG
jgi:hypothetical protein